MSTYRQFFGGGITAVEAFTGDGTEDTFSPTTTITSVNHVIVTVNGLVQRPTTHYTLVTGDIVFAEAPPNNAVIVLQIFGTSRA